MTAAQYRLVVRQGPNPGQVYELKSNEISIGRDIANDIVFNDAEVSRKHARLTQEGDRYRIEDLNSTNGTYIDGQRLIGPHLLAIGEIIMFGDNVGVVYDGEPATPDATVPSPAGLEATPVAAIPTPTEQPAQPLPQPSPQPAPPPQPPAQSISYPPAPPVQEMQEVQPEESAPRTINSWLLAGCGCLVVIAIVVIAILVFIDQPWKPGGGLYCVSPFDIIFRTLGFCP